MTKNKILEDMRRKYEFIVNSSKLSMTLISKKGYIYEAVNDALSKAHNLEREDIIGKSVGDLWGKDIFERHIKSNLDKCFEGNDIHYQSWFNFGGLGMRCMNVRCYPYYNKKSEVTNAVVISHDITDHKITEDENTRLVTAVESAGEAVTLTDTNGNVVFVNSAFETITGYKKDEVIGKNMRILKSGKHHHMFYHNLWNTIKQGVVWKGQIVNRKKDGTFITEMQTISPIVDSEGKIVNFVAVKRDITNEIDIENQLRQSQKLESIGTLVTGISHNFNNILTSIIGFSELVIDDIPESGRTRDNLEEVLKASLRAKDLVKQILTFSYKSDGKSFILFDIVPVVNETIKLLRASINTSIDIKQSINIKQGNVLGDKVLVQQIIMNLCSNAEHAMRKDGGVLEINLDETDIDSNVANSIYVKPGQYIKLTINDTGIGMTDKVKECMFDPFFTTKCPGEGTGLGLSSVHGIVKNHGGMITVASTQGKGSTFNVFIPKDEIKAALNTTQNKPKVVSRGNERILVVDDDKSLADMCKYVLQRCGYNVTSQYSSIKALEIFKAHPYDFDVAIIDLIMPEMKGDALTKAFLNIRPDMPIILSTGSEVESNTNELNKIGACMYIAKPYDASNIIEAVQKALKKRK